MPIYNKTSVLNVCMRPIQLRYTPNNNIKKKKKRLNTSEAPPTQRGKAVRGEEDERKKTQLIGNYIHFMYH